jgi:hypothetical protein
MWFINKMVEGETAGDGGDASYNNVSHWSGHSV